MALVEHPYHPIVYVRGYAMTQGEIDDTVATPYMGFNLGATKIRQDWRGQVRRHVFESALVRLMKDHGYQDNYGAGTERSGPISARSVIIYRYYEPADSDLGEGDTPTIPQAAQGLHKLLLGLREQVCGDDIQARAAFRVYLVAHSMGGLVCRCFLQNPNVGSSESKALVDKVYTYATPHNGIEMAGINVPTFLKLWDIDNFNRENIAGFLGLPGNPERVDSLNGTFDPDRFFCLVGTNPKDYEVARGLSSKLAGEMSDGLVRIENATVRGAPRAFAYRSHSGAYGIVNSEEGYQNLGRFLFGDLRVDGVLEVEALPLPPTVQAAVDEGKTVKASYYFEATVAPRGALQYKLTERRKETHSAILRRFDELFAPDSGEELDNPRSPYLFSLFLDTRKITRGRTVVFSAELAVSTTDYTIDGRLFLDTHIPGEYLFRDTVTVRATQDGDQWNVRYVLTDARWGENRGRDVAQDDRGGFIPLSSPKGFRAKLRLNYRPWA